MFIPETGEVQTTIPCDKGAITGCRVSPSTGFTTASRPNSCMNRGLWKTAYNGELIVVIESAEGEEVIPVDGKCQMQESFEAVNNHSTDIEGKYYYKKIGGTNGDL